MKTSTVLCFEPFFYKNDDMFNDKIFNIYIRIIFISRLNNS